MTDRIKEMMKSGDVEMVNLAVNVLVLTEPDFEKVLNTVEDNISPRLSIVANEVDRDIRVVEPILVSWDNTISAIFVNSTDTISISPSYYTSAI